ncbi:Septin-domain-containing protein [Calycina marina]|uniref:Septin-domain-containing protein n=1 Tax=Calycina marina TaxID=1763456 RepID=A0A9P8CAZ4_9HELO|nr:Septin-domain-containing protein [Calycina marina]
MRPLPGDKTARGSRATSFNDNEPTPLARPGNMPQMTCFFTSEHSIGTSQSEATAPATLPKQKESPNGSTYSLESLENTISSLSPDSDDGEEKVRKARKNWKRNLAVVSGRTTEEAILDSASPSNDMSRNASPSFQRRLSQVTISRPFTPLSYTSPGPLSALSGLDSRWNSDAGSEVDENASQAVISSSEEEQTTSELMDSGSVPQLVMPSIKMPSRRPFTEKGKYMGKLKVLIAGDSDTGKTSLIKAIVQTCEDIVHVDPLTSTPTSVPQSRKNSRTKSRSGSADLQTTIEIAEVHASTRAYSAWWSDLEEGRILRRRKSMGDSVLERNLCFVDTPGYGSKTSCLESMTPVVDYIEAQLQKAAALRDISDSEMISMLSGSGGTQVDVVFYLFSQRVKSIDIEYLKRLMPLTNIVPLIARSDTLSAESLVNIKSNIISELAANNIRTFPLGFSAESISPTSPFAVSTHPSKDEETMEASLLMSPDYIQPLLPSELEYLVSQIFERDTISWLRHLAAKKFIQWRNSDAHSSRPQSLYRPLNQYTSLVSSSPGLSSPVGGAASYALARVKDHTQREEKIAQVRLANWAADLQRSLQNERQRYDELARADRAIWLTEKLGECVEDGTIIPLSEARQPRPSGPSSIFEVKGAKQGTYSRRGRGNVSHLKGVNPQDPLGLLQLNEDIKAKGFYALQIVGSFGIIGSLAFWITTKWHNSGVDIDTQMSMDWMTRMGIR